MSEQSELTRFCWCLAPSSYLSELSILKALIDLGKYLTLDANKRVEIKKGKEHLKNIWLDNFENIADYVNTNLMNEKTEDQPSPLF